MSVLPKPTLSLGSETVATRASYTGCGNSSRTGKVDGPPFPICLHPTVKSGISRLASCRRRPGHAVVGISTALSLIARVALPVFWDPVVTPPVLHVGGLDGKVVSK